MEIRQQHQVGLEQLGKAGIGRLPAAPYAWHFAKPGVFLIYPQIRNSPALRITLETSTEPIWIDGKTKLLCIFFVKNNKKLGRRNNDSGGA